MGKSRQAKRRRVGYTQKKSAKETSNGLDESVANNGTAEDTVGNNPPNDTSPAQSPPEVASDEDLPDANADIVFQCASCRSVVGDTQSEYEANFEYETVSVKAASNVSVQKEIHISKKGFDAGCTYRKITCSECGNQLGRSYTSTTVGLDNLRSSFTFMHTALVSYQLGSSKTLDGQYAPNLEKHAKDQRQAANSEPAQHREVSTEAFDALDAHVSTLTEATNRLTEAFHQNKDSINEVREALESNAGSLTEVRTSLEHAQNMMLLWEERFQRLEACEEGLAKLASDYTKYDHCERRVSQLEDIFRNSNIAGSRVLAGRPQTSPMKVMPTLRKSTSPARSSVKRRRQ